ncbi:restriction endonuclease subunit S [Lactobacillus taiwanensis]|uniref:restriction endonuclease subunit S n=1 Tax=Lactobacillus taiwanensis TaxID=508451 RepID=UPI0025A999D5|nr:restriction endonuclease subunit S [Lactobacillus taiwanensis]
MKTNTLEFDAQALREKILDLAMRGKLVPQDPDDEPASVLLEKIKAEKEQLIKEKRIKKSKPLPEITDDEKPFDVPESWEWVRLGEVFEVTSSKRVMKKEWQNEGIPFYRAREIVSIKNNRPLKDPIFLNESTYNEKIKVSGVPKVDDILLTGVGTLGIPYIVKDNKKFYFKDGNIIWLKNISDINSQYLSYYIQSPYMVKEINNGRGTTVATLTIVRAKDLMIPLPPLEEQSRIAAKIAQLFALLRKIESSTQQYAKLQTLLKSKILDLAMRGKLVEQDPHDEPASVLLEKIKAEKEQLIKEKKIKKSKPLPPITDAEKPFEIPDSWEWGRLGDILLETIGGGTPSKKIENYWNGDIPWISVKDIHSNTMRIKKTQDTITNCGLKNSSTNLIKANTLVVVMRMAVGRISITDMDACINQDLRALITSKYFYDKYLLYIYPQLSFETSGITVKGIRLDNLLQTIIPLPPLLEQKRIVSKIKDLVSLLVSGN